MKILYSLNSGTPGGMEQHVLALVRGMSAAGHEVHVWCKSGEIFNWYKSAGAVMTSVEIKLDIDPVYIATLNTYLKANDIDVIHCHELKASVNGLLAARLAGTSVRVTHQHTPLSEWPGVSGYKKIARLLTIKLYAWMINTFATAEIALTQSRKQVKIAEGIRADKLMVIPNCITNPAFYADKDFKAMYSAEIRDRYKIPQDALVFGNVSRISTEKRQDFLIDAFVGLHLAPDDRVCLILAGGGDLEQEIKAKVVSANLQSKVIVTGVFDQADLPKFYGAFDVFVFPSNAEGFGLVLIEALAASLPVVASDLDVLKEVGGDTVDYFTKTSQEQLTKLMQGYVDYFKVQTQIPRNTEGRARVLALYSEAVFIRNYVELYEKGIK